MEQLTTKNSTLIVETISNVNLPQNILNEVNIKELITNIHQSQKDINKNKKNLEDAKAAYQEGNFIGNFWYNREDAIREAREDLSIAIGNLTSQSSTLIVFNTAISKVLLEQQKILNEQQEELKQQASRIQMQNKYIQKNQDELAKANEKLIEQQKRINEANQGLMEAKGISQEQAMKLINIVQRTEKLDINLKEFVSNSEKSLRTEINNIQNDTYLLHQRIINEIQKNQTDTKTEIENKLKNINKTIDNQEINFKNKINNLDNLMKSNFNLIEGDLGKSKNEMNESIEFIKNSSIKTLEEEMNKYKYTLEKKHKILISLLGVNIFLTILLSILFFITQKSLPIPNLTN